MSVATPRPALEIERLLEALAIAARPPEWHVRAACRDMGPERFFVSRGQQRLVAEARAVCAGCPVRTECLASALWHRETFGVWGGHVADELRPSRRAEDCPECDELGAAG